VRCVDRVICTLCVVSCPYLVTWSLRVRKWEGGAERNIVHLDGRETDRGQSRLECCQPCLQRIYVKKWRQQRRSWGKRAWEGEADVSSLVGKITGKNTNACATNLHFPFGPKSASCTDRFDFTNLGIHASKSWRSVPPFLEGFFPRC
jgi:hypothetical protein